MSPQLESLVSRVCVWICLCGAQMGLYEEYWSSSLLYKWAEGMKNRLWRDACIFINTNTQKSFYLFGSLFQTLLLWVFAVCATLHANRGGKKQYIWNGDWFLVFFSSFVVSASYPCNAMQGFSLLFLPSLFLQSFHMFQELQLRARVIGLTVTPIILTTGNTHHRKQSTTRHKFKTMVHVGLYNYPFCI